MSIREDEMKALVKKLGVPRRRKTPKIVLDVARIRAMSCAGFSISQIAEYFGVSHSTIDRRLHENCRVRLGLTLGSDSDSH